MLPADPAVSTHIATADTQRHRTGMSVSGASIRLLESTAPLPPLDPRAAITACSSADAHPTVDSDQPLSKSALKRLRKEERWRATQAERAAKRKEKKIQQRERKRALSDSVARGEVAVNELSPSEQRLLTLKRRRTGATASTSAAGGSGDSAADPASTPSPAAVVVDCSFNDLMHIGEIKSLQKQIAYCYSVNRRAQRPFSAIHVTSFGGQLEARFNDAISYSSWPCVYFHKEHFVDLVGNAMTARASEDTASSTIGSSCTTIDSSPTTTSITTTHDPNTQIALSKKHLVYLSGDSPNMLSSIDESKTYIIGGLVDRNRHKNICLQRATELGITHARLPIDNFIKLASRRILTTNHVFEVLLQYLETRDWEKSFLAVIPKRKGVTSASTTVQDGNAETDSTRSINEVNIDSIDTKESSAKCPPPLVEELEVSISDIE